MTERRPDSGGLEDTGSSVGRAGEARAVERTRASALWTAAAIGLVVLVAILIFVVQNSERVQIQFLGMKGTMSIGLAVLVAALLGALLMLAIGTVRILQLRRVAKRPELAARPRRQRGRPR